MNLLLPALLAAAAAQAAPETHTLLIRVREGANVYSHKMKVREGEAERFQGKADASPVRDMLVNTVVARGRGDKFGVELDVTFAHSDKTSGFELQDSLELRAGEPLIAAGCGDWTIETVLDGKPDAVAPSTGAWSPLGLDDFRLTLDLASPAATRRCREVIRGASQGAITEDRLVDGQMTEFILNAVLSEPGTGGVPVQYQIQQGSVTVQGRTTLAPGAARSVPAGDGKASFTLEGHIAAKKK